MGMLIMLAVITGGIALVGWLLAQDRPKQKRRPAQRREYAVYEDDTGIETPLGLVDDPEDEWIEWAIMDDMLNDGDGDGWW